LYCCSVGQSPWTARDAPVPLVLIFMKPSFSRILLVDYDPHWQSDLSVRHTEFDPYLGPERYRLSMPARRLCQAREEWKDVQNYADAKAAIVEEIITQSSLIGN